MLPKVWLITGCSSSLGKEIARAALAHGDKVVATARNGSTLDELKKQGATALELDVNSPKKVLRKSVASVIKETGRIDYLVNNAGYTHLGLLEEHSCEDIITQYTTNVIGIIALTRVVLPYMREQKSGVICTIGSVGSIVGLSCISIYFSSKAAITAVMQGLKVEVEPLGNEVTTVDLGMLATNFGTRVMLATTTVYGYSPSTQERLSQLGRKSSSTLGDPVKGAKVLVEILTKTGRCEGLKLPVRLPLAANSIDMLSQALKERMQEAEDWKDIVSDLDMD